MSAPGERRRKLRLLFASYHCYLDFSSGAAICSRDLFTVLAGRGWEFQVLCGPDLDYKDERAFVEILPELQLPAVVHACSAGPLTFSWIQANLDETPVSVFAPAAPRAPEPARAVGHLFLALFERTLDDFRPDLVLTYGGHWVAWEMIAAARRRGLPVVFWLHNFGYKHASLFHAVNGILVPSAFAREHYRRTLGLECTALPVPLDWSRLQCQSVEGRYVTFVNPEPNKGAFWFAGIARELARRRPDIPLLVVEGRGKADWLARTGLDVRSLGNVFVLENTPDPRDFYAVSRVVLMPSLWWEETFGRVAAEALLNGIPVLASRRGALPETLGDAGFVLDVPDRFTPQTALVPSAEDVAPWVDTLVRLWDDAAHYEEQRRRCLAAAERWRPERLAAAYDAYFGRVLRLPGLAGADGAGARDGAAAVSPAPRPAAGGPG
jgi:glycosyltransferase involved in cell wall biosynthesis